jgi:hypothetical protein
MWALLVSLSLPGPVYAPPLCGKTYSYRCRDGAKTARAREPSYPGHDKVTRTPICDADSQCDGACTFDWGKVGVEFAPFTVAVGDRFEFRVNDLACLERYICKRGRRARCRKLAG